LWKAIEVEIGLVMTHHRLAWFGVAFQVIAALLHAESPNAKIRILVLDTFGQKISETVRVRVKDGGVDKAVNIHGNGIGLSRSLRETNYTFEYSASSYVKGSRRVSVMGASMDVLLALAMQTTDQLVGEGPINPWVVSGILSPRPDGQVVVKLISLYSGLAVESAIDPQGAFFVELFPQGNYLLVVLAGPMLLYQRQLIIDQGIPRSVNLGTLTPVSTPPSRLTAPSPIR
jgi:hypothetical protein